MLKRLAGLFLGALLLSAPAWAQDQDVVVVTAQMIQHDEDAPQDINVSGGVAALPYISIKVPADFVIFTVALESGAKSEVDRNRDLEKTFTLLTQRVGKARDVTMEVGQPGYSSAVETAAAHEVIVYGSDRSEIPVVLKFTVKPNETFGVVRTRAEAFIKTIEVSGRAEATTGDLQYIGVSDPAKHREDLLRKIAADVRLTQDIFSAGGSLPGISITGLSARVKTRPTGPLELEMYLPYNVVLGQPLPQPPR